MSETESPIAVTGSPIDHGSDSVPVSGPRGSPSTVVALGRHESIAERIFIILFKLILMIYMRIINNINIT